VVKPTTLFRKVVEGIGKKMGVDPRAIRLVYNGDKCHLEHNPKMLEMVAGRTYELESLTEQTGGGKVRFLFLSCFAILDVVSNTNENSDHA
jgi:hypothetical protein